MTSIYDIAGYVRISVDDEQTKDNVSIENQKAIIADFVKTKFPGSSLTFFEDRDRSGYTFEQREGYQAMRKGLVGQTYHILIVKDFSRFSRRNSRGLVELFDLYVETEMDLVFSGHAHGGQFRLPFVGGLVAPNQGFFPKYDAGLFSEGSTNMIVSKGVGNSIIPIRFNNRPEIIVATLCIS